MIVVPDLASLVVFVAAALVLLLTLGPAVLYIVARSIDQGRRASSGLAWVIRRAASGHPHPDPLPHEGEGAGYATLPRRGEEGTEERTTQSTRS